MTLKGRVAGVDILHGAHAVEQLVGLAVDRENFTCIGEADVAAFEIIIPSAAAIVGLEREARGSSCRYGRFDIDGMIGIERELVRRPGER